MLNQQVVKVTYLPSGRTEMLPQGRFATSGNIDGPIIAAMSGTPVRRTVSVHNAVMHRTHVNRCRGKKNRR